MSQSTAWQKRQVDEGAKVWCAAWATDPVLTATAQARPPVSADSVGTAGEWLGVGGWVWGGVGWLGWGGWGVGGARWGGELGEFLGWEEDSEIGNSIVSFWVARSTCCT